MNHPWGHTIADSPAHVTATSILKRVIDGLGFRYHWATEGLDDHDLAFQPSPTSMTLGELLNHTLGLVGMIEDSLSIPQSPAADPSDASTMRSGTLTRLAAISDRLGAMPDGELAICTVHDQPIWHLINGPVADALTHVGQITGWRRIMGKPVAKANVFLGQPPS